MSDYTIHLDESVAAGVRRVSLEQIDDALDDLRSEDDDRAERIHDARKRMKKVRAALRLVRDGIGEDVFDRENHAARDAARLLAPARDAKVHLDTLDAVRTHFGDSLKRNAFDALEDALNEHHAEKTRHLAESGALDEAADMIAALRDRVADWPIPHDGFETARLGMKRVYKRGQKGLVNSYDASASGSADERFHEWRKRVKYLWYQLRLLGPAWPGVFEAWAEDAHHISNLLGDDHDLAELRRTVADLDEAEGRDALFALLDQRHAELRTAARPVGCRLYVESPSAFVDRIEAYWTIAYEGR